MNGNSKLLEILATHGIEEDKAKDLLDPIKELNNKYPKLSEEEIRSIASEIVDKFLEIFGPLPKKSDEETMRKRLHDIVLGIAIGVGSNVAFYLLVYLFTQTKMLFAPVEHDSKELLREAEEKAKAEMALSPAVRRKLREERLTLYLLPQSFGIDLEKKVCQEKVVQEFVETVEEERGVDFEKMCYASLAQLIYGLLVHHAKQKLMAQYAHVPWTEWIKYIDDKDLI